MSQSGPPLQLDDAPPGEDAVRIAAAPRVSIVGVTKEWSRDRGPVLDNVTLDFAAGSVISMYGANGAGKTTLLRILAGLIYPDSGTVRLNGLDARKDRRDYQSSLGFVSAGNAGLYARFSPRRHLDYWARLAFIPSSERGDAIERALELFGLTPYSDRRVDRLSMGERQRVRLAMGFLHSPTVLLLDEPWNSLDQAGMDIVRNAMTTFRSRGATIVCVSPTGETLEGLADERFEVGGGLVMPR
jgi:ABC-type multidrug transport system ATPase subunit